MQKTGDSNERPTVMSRVSTILVSFALTLPLLAAEPPKTLTVDAGKFARRGGTMVNLNVPDAVGAESQWEIRDTDANLLAPLQVLPGGGRAVTVLPPLKPGQS